jgi:hypothetical protein
MDKMTFNNLTIAQLIRIVAYASDTYGSFRTLRDVSKSFRETVDYHSETILKWIAFRCEGIGKRMCKYDDIYGMRHLFYYKVEFDKEDLLSSIKSHRMCQYLLRNGCKADDNSLIKAYSSDEIRDFDILYTYIKEPFIDGSKQAIRFLCYVRLDFLAQYGFDINRRSIATGDTILHNFLRRETRYIDFVYHFKKGMKFDIKNNDGMTALDIIASKSDNTILICLIRNEHIIIKQGVFKSHILIEAFKNHHISSILPILESGFDPTRYIPELIKLASKPSPKQEEYIAKIAIVNQFMTKPHEYPRLYLQCYAITKAGNHCKISRSGNNQKYCHIHEKHPNQNDNPTRTSHSEDEDD